MLEKGLDENASVWTENQLSATSWRGPATWITRSFRRRRLPVGSGAIESAIRRVINLRMKGNSIFWKQENAEGMLLLRGFGAQPAFGRRPSPKITQSMASDRRTGLELAITPNMPDQLKAGIAIEPPQPPNRAATSYLRDKLHDPIMGMDPAGIPMPSSPASIVDAEKSEQVMSVVFAVIVYFRLREVALAGEFRMALRAARLAPFLAIRGVPCVSSSDSGL